MPVQVCESARPPAFETWKAEVGDLSLETLFAHFEEHGCHILIRDGEVENFGTWDAVLDEGDANEDGPEL